MRDRVKSLKRIVDVQKHLHSMEEIKYVRLQQRVRRCQDEQRELAEALSSEDALRGLFMDVTARRLQALRQEERRLTPQLEKQASVLLEHGGRLRNSEQLAEALGVELARVEEREELERLLEARFAQGGASSKQDR
jgi:hypothetical protein